MSDTNEGRRRYEEFRARALADPEVRTWYEEMRDAFEAAADDYAAATTWPREDVLAGAYSLISQLRLAETMRQVTAILAAERPPRRSRVAWSKRKRKRARRRSA